jgi:hypothetical protein
MLDVARSEIPAVTHVNGSARVQTVSPDGNPAFHALIRAFGERTGCPVLLNTSFNLRGEPIVRTPGDACRTFVASGLDGLALGSFYVQRPPGVEPTGTPPPPRVFPPKPDRRRLRLFGIGGGVIWSLVAGLLWRGGLVTAAVGLWSLAGVLLVLGLVAPTVLRPVERGLRVVGRAVSRVVTAALLAGVYLIVLTPVSWLRRAVAGDPLARRLEPERESYWEEAERDVDRYRRMY